MIGGVRLEALDIIAMDFFAFSEHVQEKRDEDQDCEVAACRDALVTAGVAEAL